MREVERGDDVDATLTMLAIVDFFGNPRTPENAVESLAGLPARSVRQAIRLLRRRRMLLSESEGLSKRSRLTVWRGNVAAAHYHAAVRDTQYVTGTAARREFFRTNVAIHRRPARFKRFETAVRRLLASKKRPDAGISLETALRSRRTVRAFSRKPVSFDDLAAVVGGTFRRTGWIDAGGFGLFATKTSPSAGALHPIECYVLAWNVRGLPPGLYHYDVAADQLRRLRRGDLRREAIRAASGQRWVGSAGFLCILTAVFTRSLWKYQLEDAYRDLWLDAGHLAQTFCLLATAHGLGPFTTVALQDSHIEALLGLDGVGEFPVYLCGAGVPSRRLLPPRG
jgi:SagB-type dehydrogenase family enzyme